MVRTLPDLEMLVGDWLRDHPDLQALDARVAGETPGSTTRPWIRVTLLAADDDLLSNAEHLIAWVLQLDCYAGQTATVAHNGQAEAQALRARARAVLKGAEGTIADGLVVTRVRFTGDARLPDTAFEPARQRYVLTVEITGHAV